MIHELKCWPIFFTSVAVGDKNFEIRRYDRDFKKGDQLQLNEWNPETEKYTGQKIMVDVTYMFNAQNFGIIPGYCVMSIQLTGVKNTFLTDYGDATREDIQWIEIGRNMHRFIEAIKNRR